MAPEVRSWVIYRVLLLEIFSQLPKLISYLLATRGA